MDNYLLPTTKRPIIVFGGFFVCFLDFGGLGVFWWVFLVDFFKQKLFSRKLIVSFVKFKKSGCS